GISAVSVLLNNGDGTFGTPTLSGTSYPVESVTVGDFNRDGKADLALGFEYAYYLYSEYDWWTDTYYDVYETDVGVSALEGNGDGAFVSETDVITDSYLSAYTPVSDPINSLAVGDFDRNGFPDVAAIEFNGFADVAINTQPSVGLQMAVTPTTAP